jgi:hypothetical protein
VKHRPAWWAGRVCRSWLLVLSVMRRTHVTPKAMVTGAPAFALGPVNIGHAALQTGRIAAQRCRNGSIRSAAGRVSWGAWI